MGQQVTLDEAEHLCCPLRNGLPCVGKKCMAWEWSNPFHHEFIIQSNGSIKNTADLVPPEGKGWTLDRTYNPHVFKGDIITTAYVNLRWMRPWGPERKGFCSALEAKLSEVQVG